MIDTSRISGVDTETVGMDPLTIEIVVIVAPDGALIVTDEEKNAQHA